MRCPIHRRQAIGLAIGWGLAIAMAWPASGDGRPSPDDVLRARGLRRVGSAYILKDEEDLGGRMGRLQRLFAEWKRDRGRLDGELASLNRLQHRYAEFSETGPPGARQDGPGPPPGEPMPPPGLGPGLGPGPGSRGDGPPPDGMRGFGPRDRDGPRGGPDRRRIDRLRAELEAKITLGQVAVDQLADRLEVELRELRRRRGEAVDLISRMANRYAELSAEAPVQEALLAIHRTGTSGFTLGSGRDLAGELQRMLASIDPASNPPRNPDSRLEWDGASRLRGLVGAADLLLHKVAVDAGRLANQEHDNGTRRKLLAEQRLKEQRLGAASRETAADRVGAERDADERRALRMRTESLSSEQAQARAAGREILDDLADAQEEFLHVAGAIRNALAPAAPAPTGATSGGSSPTPNAARVIPGDPAAESSARRLKEFEKAIRSERVAVDVDRGLIWVEVTIDGKHRLRMIADPTAGDIRLAASTASEAGIRPYDGEPAVEITTLDGRKFAARRAPLAPVQIGPFILRDLECLVLPPEFGEAPPSLGGAFFKRISAKIDRGAGTMTLTQLQVKPILRAERASAVRPATTTRGNTAPSPAEAHPRGDAPPSR